MCTVILLRNSEDWEYPLRIAANRDEMVTRPWRIPGRHWSDRPYICGVLDCQAGGSWFGLNDSGVGAVILNRRSSKVGEYRSRGELVLYSLDYKDAQTALSALLKKNLYQYRPFNLIIFDVRHGFVLSQQEDSTWCVHPVPEGLSMITACDLNDFSHPRIRNFYERFQKTPWAQWHTLLAEHSSEDSSHPEYAMCFTLPNGFGTLCSSMVALSRTKSLQSTLWLFSEGPPGTVPWRKIEYP